MANISKYRAREVCHEALRDQIKPKEVHPFPSIEASLPKTSLPGWENTVSRLSLKFPSDKMENGAFRGKKPSRNTSL